MKSGIFGIEFNKCNKVKEDDKLCEGGIIENTGYGPFEFAQTFHRLIYL